MSDNSLEAVEATSEPVSDVKETVQVETAETETEANKEVADEEVKEGSTPAEEVKEPTKYEKLEAEKLAQQKGMQKRIDRQTAVNKATMEKMQTLQDEIAQYKATNPDVDDAPRQEDFDNWEDYNKAVVDHKADKLVQERMQEAKQAELAETQRVEYERNMKEFETKEQAFRDDNPEYDANSASFNEQVKYLQQQNSPSLQYANEMLLSSDVSPALINELGANPEMAEEWSTMSPAQVVREVVYLEQRLSVKPETKVEEPKPKPIKALKGNGKAKTLTNMNPDELLKKFNV